MEAGEKSNEAGDYGYLGLFVCFIAMVLTLARDFQAGQPLLSFTELSL